jgi:predicted transcriptional regulator
MKYRSRTDIVALILESASDRPILKTQLKYMAFLPYEHVKILIPILVKNDLLAFNEQTRQFRITPKGLRYLELYDGIRQCVDYISSDEAQSDKKKRYWQTELKSLGFDPKGKNNHELNDPDKLKSLADSLKLSMYHAYKAAFSDHYTEYKEEAESSISA